MSINTCAMQEQREQMEQREPREQGEQMEQREQLEQLELREHDDVPQEPEQNIFFEPSLADLNPAQLEAVTSTEGYIRVIAGAGSGKTRALSRRFAFLVNDLGILPGHILCVTFTNKAANEMRQRIHRLTGDNDTAYVNTFHGFCVSVLQEDIYALQYPKSFLVLDNSDIDAMLGIIYEERGLTLRDMTFSKARDMIEMRKLDKEPSYYIDMLSMSLDDLHQKYQNAEAASDIIFYGYLYQEKKCFGLDYNDLIKFCLYLFETHDDIRLKWQQRLEYIMIDEFQDIDPPQYELMQVLAGYHKNLFVVGDPDQTIYTWRGADVRFLLNFDKVFVPTKTIMMMENYRSTPEILKAANALIQKNQDRIEKDLIPAPAPAGTSGTGNPAPAESSGAGSPSPTLAPAESSAAGNAVLAESRCTGNPAPAGTSGTGNPAPAPAESSAAQNTLADHDTPASPGVRANAGSWGNRPVLCHHGETADAEATWITSRIKELHDSGTSYRDVAILYRAHYLTRTLEDALRREEIPYTIYSGVQFFNRMEIKDALSYLRMIAYKDDLSFLRIANVPKRNLGQRRMKFLQEFAEQNTCSLYEALVRNLDHELLRTTKASAFYSLIEKYAADYDQRPVSEVLSAILHESGYETMLRTEGSQERLDNLAELKQSIYDYEISCGEECTLEHYLAHVALFTNSDAADGAADKVKLMTVHTAKGLEFLHVFICAMNEGIFPSKKTRTREAMEEERRLAFVAITRAQKGLFLSEAEGRNLDGSPRYPSRFLLDIGADNLTYTAPPRDALLRQAQTYIAASTASLGGSADAAPMEPGTRVIHRAFGPGTILAVDPAHQSYQIKFDRLETARTLTFRAELIRE